MAERGSKRIGRPRATTPTEGGAARTRLAALADKLGNDAMADRIAQGRAHQDELAAFVTARLQRVAEIQHREIALTRRDGAHWKAWRAMGDRGLADIKEGQPTRWREVALAYERALVASSRGELQRAKQLVAEAREIELRVLQQTTALVRTDDVVEGSPDPSWLADAVLWSSTVPGEVPAATRDLIRDIVNVMAEMPTMRGKPRIGTRPWWAEEDEDDEEHDEDG